MGRFKVAAGAAVVVVAATGVAFAGGAESARLQASLAAPKIDGESARAAVLSHLVKEGLSEAEARERMANQDAALKAAARLRTRVPDHVGYFWLDDDGNLMVRVLDDVGEREASAVGATPVLSTFAAGDLEEARDALAKDAEDNPPEGLSGAAFGVDESAGKVIARYFFEKSGGAVPEAADDLGDLVTATAEVGELAPQMDVMVAGASMKSRNGEICTAGWAVDITDANGGTPRNGVMTAGHCFESGLFPHQNKYEIDTEAGGNTPAKGAYWAFGDLGDYGVLELGDGHRGSATMIDGLHVVEAVQEPVKGAFVCKHGQTTQQTCGEITLTNISVLSRRNHKLPPGQVHPWYMVEGLTRVGFCAEGGDSGAPVFAEFDEGTEPSSIAALGIASAAITHPDSEGKKVCGEKVGKPNEAYFQPLSGIDTEGEFKFRVRIRGG